jgi:colicin import membrane protein
MARTLKVFRTHIGFHDLIIASPSRKAALDAWGASAHLFTQGFAAETKDPALVKAALARPGMVLRRQFGSQGAFNAGPPALRLIGSPPRAEPKAPAKASAKEPRPADHTPSAKRAHTTQKHAQRERAESERAEQRAAQTQARAEARKLETERRQAAAEWRRDLQSQLQSLQDDRRKQLRDIDRREQDLSRERRELEQSFETRIVALQRRLRNA